VVGVVVVDVVVAGGVDVVIDSLRVLCCSVAFNARCCCCSSV
jgi:hypothetical protein